MKPVAAKYQQHGQLSIMAMAGNIISIMAENCVSISLCENNQWQWRKVSINQLMAAIVMSNVMKASVLISRNIISSECGLMTNSGINGEGNVANGYGSM